MKWQSNVSNLINEYYFQQIKALNFTVQTKKGYLIYFKYEIMIYFIIFDGK